MKSIKIVGVVGAGTMGSALAQKFAQEGYTVLLADRAMNFVEKGLNGIKATLQDAIEKNVFTADQVNSFLANLTITASLADLKVCDIVIEAIFEDMKAKTDLFKTLSGIVSKDCILATNTSSFSVNEMAIAVESPERFIGIHYFYHAAKNRLVEIIPGKSTTEEVVKAVYRFSVLSGKDPIYTKDAYGFAVNRFFVPWLNEGVKLVNEKAADTSCIDVVCMKAFGIGMGPFALMNATGVPITLHAERTLEVYGPSYKACPLLEVQVAAASNWPVGEKALADVTATEDKLIRERMLGSVFFVCTQILNEKVCTAADLNKGAKIGLRWRKGPVDLMKEMGEGEVKRLVEQYATLYNEKIPSVSSDSWKMEQVCIEKKGKIAILSMNRPEDLNALNEEVINQLEEKFLLAENDSNVDTIFITGSGKAFVAGADIKLFIRHMKSNSLDKIVAFTTRGQQVFEKIDQSKKKVVALLNGLTLGGGLELALCADVILAVPKAKMAFPETGIGIYPGLGGTQRSANRMGKGLAKYLILTGKMLSATEAAEIGLVDALISPEELFELLDGTKAIPSMAKKELAEKWNAIAQLYTKNSFREIMSGNYSNGFMDKTEAAKLAKTMSFKAPIAMQIAEDLIEQAKGTTSELEKLTTIFSTSDAMKGLTSIGQKVEYEGK